MKLKIKRRQIKLYKMFNIEKMCFKYTLDENPTLRGGGVVPKHYLCLYVGQN